MVPNLSNKFLLGWVSGQPLAALQYCSCTAGRNSQFTVPRLRCHVTETFPVFDTPNSHLHTQTPDNTILVIFICHCYSTLRRQTDNNSKNLSWHSQARGNLLLSGSFLRSWTMVLENVKTRTVTKLSSVTGAPPLQCTGLVVHLKTHPVRKTKFDKMKNAMEEELGGYCRQITRKEKMFVGV